MTREQPLHSIVDPRLIRVLARMALQLLEDPDPDVHARKSVPQSVQPRAGQPRTGRCQRSDKSCCEGSDRKRLNETNGQEAFRE